MSFIVCDLILKFGAKITNLLKSLSSVTLLIVLNVNAFLYDVHYYNFWVFTTALFLSLDTSFHNIFKKRVSH